MRENLFENNKGANQPVHSTQSDQRLSYSFFEKYNI